MFRVILHYAITGRSSSDPVDLPDSRTGERDRMINCDHFPEPHVSNGVCTIAVAHDDCPIALDPADRIAQPRCDPFCKQSSHTPSSDNWDSPCTAPIPLELEQDRGH